MCSSNVWRWAMKKILISILVSISLVLGNGNVLAHWNGGGWHGWNNDGWYGNAWNDNDWVGPAIGLVAAAIILNQVNHSYYYRQPYYNPGYNTYYRGYYRGYNTRYYHSYNYNSRYYTYYNVHCGWVRGHYDYYGYWIPRQRVCWR